MLTKNRRRYLRAPYQGSMIGHNQKKVFECRALNVSVVGLSFYCSRELFVGSQIIIHNRPGRGLSSFNVLCEVVSSSRIVDPKDPKKAVHKCSVKFLKVSPKIQEEIHKFTQKIKIPSAA